MPTMASSQYDLRELNLQSGDMRATVRPDLGGCLTGLWCAGLEILRSTPASSLDSVRQSACFAMVPYSNRLGHGRFDWLGQTHTTRLNFPNSPHSLHGVGWQRPWTADQVTNNSVRLRYCHKPDGDWPFAFVVEQHIGVEPYAMCLQINMRNTDDRTQPAGLGWHPYFVRREGAKLDIELTSRWDKDASELPLTETPIDGLHAKVAELDLDHCFTGWSGVARLSDSQMVCSLHSDLRWLVVFTPPERNFYCVEPVSHRNDAVHSQDPLAEGLVSLAPGANLQAQLRLQIEQRG